MPPVLAGKPGGLETVLGPRWVQEADSDSDGSIAAYLATNHPRTPARLGQCRFVVRLTHAVEWRYGVTPQHLRRMVGPRDPGARRRTSGALESIAAPTLVVTRPRRHHLAANSRIIAGRIPDARLRVVAGAGHSFSSSIRCALRLVLDFPRGAPDRGYWPVKAAHAVDTALRAASVEALSTPR